MKSELLTYRDPKSPVSEVFRTLRTNIQFMNTNRKLKTLLVTSTFPEEGKTWVTANLAVTFAQAGKKVILIDADMRKGRQYKIFDILPKPGLSNYLSNMDADDLEISDVNIVNYIQETGVENLHVLVAGNVPPNPSELLVSTKMREVLKELREMCDLIIIDGTPCDLVTDSIILSRFVDSTIIVTAQKETKKDSLQRVTKNIQNVGGRIAGVIVNKVDISSKKYKDTYYYGSISGKSLMETEDKKHGLFNMFSSKDDDYDYDYEDEDQNRGLDDREEQDNNEIIENINIQNKDNDNNSNTVSDDTIKLNPFDFSKRKSKRKSKINNEANDIVNSLFEDMENKKAKAEIEEKTIDNNIEKTIDSNQIFNEENNNNFVEEIYKQKQEASFETQEPSFAQQEPTYVAPKQEPVYEEKQQDSVYNAPQQEPIYDISKQEMVHETPKQEPVYEKQQEPHYYDEIKYKTNENNNYKNSEEPVIDKNTLENINAEMQKLSNGNNDDKTQEIINIVNNYVQDELRKHNEEGKY